MTCVPTRSVGTSGTWCISAAAASCTLLEVFLRRVRREEDDDHADGIDERGDAAGAGVVVVEGGVIAPVPRTPTAVRMRPN